MPLQSDQVLWETLRIRRRFEEPIKGVDAIANRWRTRAKHARVGLKYLRREAESVIADGKRWEEMEDSVLDERIVELRQVFARRNHKAEHLRAAMSAVREVAYRETGERPFMVQVMGAMGLFHGQIVEMVTGEGKTLTASVAAAVLGWLRRSVHVITVNDYLAERDADGRQPIFRRCGLVAAPILGDTPEGDRLQAYRRPIVYTTQKELVADWLRDQLRLGKLTNPVSMRWVPNGAGGRRGGRPPTVLVPALHTAIVDEADAVLIDEAVTPLIIAQPRGEDPQGPLYARARDLARELKHQQDFTLEPVKRRAKLTGKGRAAVGSLIGDDDHGIWRAVRRREECVEQALVAEHLYLPGQHYQIVDGRVVIVDEFTGRFMEDRQWQHGLHQAVEAKHDVEVTADRDTLASMSFQRYFRLYTHLCGMTGTAADAKAEMETTYGRAVRVIPTNRPLARVKLPDQIYLRMEQKFDAITREVIRMHRLGRPVLVGTRSIEVSEILGQLFTEAKLKHQVLNAVHHKIEAQIISEAGAPGAITVATNMAGRGTDVKLDKGVAEVGGLHVILTEVHAASRIDRQLVGRSGRQGDPGSSRSIISLEDELVVKYAPKLGHILSKRYTGWEEPLPNWTRAAFNLAQRRAQRRAYQSRASVMRRDEELDRNLPR